MADVPPMDAGHPDGRVGEFGADVARRGRLRAGGVLRRHQHVAIRQRFGVDQRPLPRRTQLQDVRTAWFRNALLTGSRRVVRRFYYFFCYVQAVRNAFWN